MDLVINKVMQLQQVHEPNSRALLERLACPSVVQLNLSTRRHLSKKLAMMRPGALFFALRPAITTVLVRLIKSRVDFSLGTPVKHRGDRLESENLSRPTKVRLKNLTNIHTRRNTKRVEHDIDRSPVIHKRHVFLRNHACNHTLVPVTTRHLVARRQSPLRRDVDLDHFEHTVRKLVATLHVRDLPLLLSLNSFNAWPVLTVRNLSLLLELFRTLDPLDIEGLDLLVDNLRNVRSTDLLTSHRVNHLGTNDLVDLLGHLLKQLNRLRVLLRFIRGHLSLERLLLSVVHVNATRELLRPDHNAGGTSTDLE